MSERLQKAVSYALGAGYQLEKGAFELLQTLSQREDPMKLMEKAIEKAEMIPTKPLFIGRDFLGEIVDEIFPKEGVEAAPLQPSPPSPMVPFKTQKKVFRAYAKDVAPEIKVLEDPTDKICTTGSLGEYLEYFQDRFKRLERLFRRRMDTKDATPISEALKAPDNSKVKIVCMVTEKREAKQRIFLRVEDLEASATVLVQPGANSSIMEKARATLLDQVVCISAIKGRNDLLIAEDIVLPDVLPKKPNVSSVPVYAALISDLHVGSGMFLRKPFSHFILWLKGKFGDERLRRVAGHVKYVVIAGDLVDGIGVYPGQAKELAIRDVHRQHRMLAKLIAQIPEYIEVIVIPGNHDASRKALPQPAIPKDYAEPLYEAREIHSLGNPSTISLHGVELLLYHGRSLDDVIGSVPNVGFNSPEKAMRLLLQCRHMAPTYGQRTPIASEKRDFMIIERVPDIFHAGHIHVLKHDTYRGVLLLNSGAWQGQTDYQKKMGLTPTPGIAPIVNLQTLEVTTLDFKTAEAWT